MSRMVECAWKSPRGDLDLMPMFQGSRLRPTETMTPLIVKFTLDSGEDENKRGTSSGGVAVVYRNKPDRLENSGPLIGEMTRCRDAAIRAACSAMFHGVIYHALQMVVAAIDGAAHSHHGQPYYFSEGGTGPSESERARAERQEAFERGEGEL